MTLYVLEILMNVGNQIEWTGVDGLFLTEKAAKNRAKKEYGARPTSQWSKGIGRYYAIHPIENFYVPKWLAPQIIKDWNEQSNHKDTSTENSSE